MDSQCAILGGGLSGIALAARLRKSWTLYEAGPALGGLCGTIEEQGFTFDVAGPHILFSKNKAVLADMVAALGANVREGRRENKIWFQGHLVKYPFENGLGDLPKEALFECLHGYLDNPSKGTPTNLEEWSYATFGKGISELYFLPYNRKIWNAEPADIALEWVSRIPKPPMVDVLKSAIGIPTEGYLHQLFFQYPVNGGIQALVDGYARQAREGRIHTGAPVLRLSGGPGRWEVETAVGTTRHEEVVSTIPIHELAKVWDGFPGEARAALQDLRYNSLITLLIGQDRDRALPYTALYVPAPEIPFHRVSFPKVFSETCVPPGGSSLMVEATCREGDGTWCMSDDALLERAILHLEKMDLLDRARVVYRRVTRSRYAYPIYDRKYAGAVEALRGAVARSGVKLLGRFAEFDYINSDVCVERAIAMATSLGGSMEGA